MTIAQRVPLAVEVEQCAAIADSTGKQCERDPLPGIPYCGLHRHLFDPEADLTG